MSSNTSAAKWLSFGMITSSLILVMGLNSTVRSGMELLRVGLRDSAQFARSPQVHIPSSFTIRCDADADLNINPLEVRVNNDGI
ncbi:MAG: hypothetical protein ACYTGL_12450 [Planctomycetota bacterium]|jgi:hypothetical protein